MQECLVWRVLQGVPRQQLPQAGPPAKWVRHLEVEAAYTQNCYQCGRDGDHLMGVPFECDLCSFQNVVCRDPDDTDAQDEFTLMAIRRVLLDVMWARKPNTVASNWFRSKRDFDMAVGNLSPDYRTILLVLGNPMVEDWVVLGMALTTLLALLRPGKTLLMCSLTRYKRPRPGMPMPTPMTQGRTSPVRPS
jgi:hypothetical protein